MSAYTLVVSKKLTDVLKMVLNDGYRCNIFDCFKSWRTGDKGTYKRDKEMQGKR
jgi:hypothetical protein